MSTAWRNRWCAVWRSSATAFRAALVLALVAGFWPAMPGHAASDDRLKVSDPVITMGAGALHAQMMTTARTDTRDVGLGLAPRGCANPAVAACNMHCLERATGPVAPVPAVKVRLVDMRLIPDATRPPPSRDGAPPRRPPKIGA